MIVNEDNFQKLLCNLLKENGELRKDIAAKAGVHDNTVGRWCRGESYPTLPQLCWVLTALGKHLEVRENEDCCRR